MDTNYCFVVSSYASGGDLFRLSLDESDEPPGSKREDQFASVVIELLSALKRLHDLQIVHRDISLENVLQDNDSARPGMVRIIDFGMAAKGRYFQNCPRGKPSYEAPEMQTPAPYDAFLSDTFAAGVVVYSVLIKDYPWLSTKPGRCKCFEYFKTKGFAAFCQKRRVRDGNARINDHVSPELMQLLEGMLELDPSRRLTLGEKQFGNRRSVWDEPWIKNQMKKQDSVVMHRC